MNMLLDALSAVGTVLDTPGSVARGLLAGEGGKAVRGIWNPSERVSGRDMLENWGALSPNQEGLDWGDAAGFGAELITDPTNFIGGKALLKALRNPVESLAKGPRYITDDVLQNTKVVDELGNPKRLYHGTASSYDWPDVNKVDPQGNLYGRGFYMTEDPQIASGIESPSLSAYLQSRSIGRPRPANWFEDFIDPPVEGMRDSHHKIIEKLPGGRGISDLEFLRNIDPSHPSKLLDMAADNFPGYAQARALDHVARSADDTASYVGTLGNAAEDVDDAVWAAKTELENKLDRVIPDENLGDYHDELSLLTSRSLDEDSYRDEPLSYMLKMANHFGDRAKTYDVLPPVNTRMHYADVRSPFDMDAIPDKSKVAGIADNVKRIYEGEAGWGGGPRPVNPDEIYFNEGPIQDLHGYLNEIASGPQAAGMNNNLIYQELASTLGKKDANYLLAQSGYDGITHVGGGRMGGGRLNHQVWIPFHQNQLYLPYMPPMEKHLNPMVNPLAAAMAGHNAVRPWGE